MNRIKLQLTSIVLVVVGLLNGNGTAIAAEIHSADSGDWSSPKTWKGGALPAGGDKVLIREGHAVVYDVESKNVIRSIHISGTLTFAHDKDTRLEVGLIRIAPGNRIVEEGFECEHTPDAKKLESVFAKGGQPGFSALCACCDNKAALLVGTPERPVQAKHTALIRLHYIDGMNRQSCPAIVCCGGRMDFHGAPLEQTWLKLNASTRADSRTVVTDDPPQGWRVGDRVILTGSSGNFGGRRPQTEQRSIVAIDGSRLRLDKPLLYHHSGEGEFRAEIANLTRNVVVESARPDGVRGHTMYHAHSAGSISYAEFRHLGKRGALGRYPVHFHLCRDSMRGSSVVGASIWDSHNRWLVIHGTEYLVVKDCVGYKSVGHGFFLEDGTEVFNTLDRNLAVAAVEGKPLPKQALPFDKNEGAGFWWANSHNTFTRNVAADCSGYGFRYEATPRAGFRDKSSGETFGEYRRPFDLTMRIRQANGRSSARDIRTLPFIRFDDNTAHNIANYALNLGQDAGGIGPDEAHPFVVRRMKIWNAQRGYTVHVPNVLIDGMWIHRCGYEIYRASYRSQDYRNVRLSGIRGQFEVTDLKSYVATGRAVVRTEVGLNRNRLPGFPRGTGAGGTAYHGARIEAAVLTPIDDLPPITVITDVRRNDDTLVIRGTTTDNGTLRHVVVNGQKARLLDDHGSWEARLKHKSSGVVKLTASAEDTAGNQEQTPHTRDVVIR